MVVDEAGQRPAGEGGEEQLSVLLRGSQKMTTTFPRRSFVEPNRELAEGNNEEQEEEEESSIDFARYTSPCFEAVSNEEFTEEALEGFQNGACFDANGEIRTFYGGCFESSEDLLTNYNDGTDSKILPLEIGFDFELYLSKATANTGEAIDSLEGIMIEHMGAIAGLKDCASETHEQVRRRDLAKQYHDFTDGELDKFLAVSSEPISKYDSELGK